MPGSARAGRAAAAALLAMLVFAAPAAAQNTKPYKLVITPDPVLSGAGRAMTATFSVPAGATQQLGSVDLTSPFVVRSVSAPAPATVQWSPGDSVIRLRNMSLQPGSQMAVTITVDVPACSAGSGPYDWTAQAKQANDFNGPPGNDMSLTADSDLRTAVACGLRFTTQPQSAKVGDRITGTPYDTAGTLVSVAIVDGAGNPIPSATGDITLGLGLRSGFGSLNGQRTVTTQAGVAAFDVSIDAPGTYTLVASSPGLTSATSSAFSINQIALLCPEGSACPPAPQLSSGASTIDVSVPTSGDGGYLSLSLITPPSSTATPPLVCPGYAHFSPDVALVDGPRTKTITYVIDKTQMQRETNNGVSFLEMCYGAPEPFPVKTGSAVYDADFGGYVGLLPDCTRRSTNPCVVERRADRAGNGIIVGKAPAGDPAWRP